MNKRIRLSSKDTKKREVPGSPWRPERPRNCRSTLLDSWRSVPMMARPPAARDSGVSFISVPRPAMLVAMVTVPGLPASATISASRWCCFAFNTLCLIFFICNILLRSSEISTEVVPTNTGRPSPVSLTISSTTALNFSRTVLNTKSSMSLRVMGLLVGMVTTSSL